MKKLIDTTIVMFSTADWDNPFWTNKQHVAARLAKLGYRIIYIESIGLRRPGLNKGDASRIFSKLKKIFKMIRRVDSNIWVFTPFVIPFHHWALVRLINRGIFRFSFFLISSFLKSERQWVWTYHPMVNDYLEMLNPKKIIYHSVDDLSAAPRFPKEDILKNEELLLHKADHIFVTSLALKEKYQGQISKTVHYFPNVCDYEHFSKAVSAHLSLPEDIKTIQTPRVGFVGAISHYKVDFELLAELATKRPEWSFVLIGKVGEGDPDTNVEILNLPNIYMIGPKSYADLPQYLAGFDVVLIPCRSNDYTKAMFPMKFFEYLAAEKMIVASDLPALVEFRDLFIQAKDASEFEKGIMQVLNKERLFDEKMRTAAKENTWDSRMIKMLDIVEGGLK